MNERDQALLEMRPRLSLDNSKAGEAESFQNKTLRPLLKLQNPLLKIMVREWLDAHKQDLTQQEGEEAKKLIEHILKTNKGLRATLFAMVVGLMTEEEVEEYLQHKREMNRRLTTMLIQRLQDQLIL